MLIRESVNQATTTASDLKKASAGDFDYDKHGQGYARQRRTDPRIAALVHQALGSARTVLNIGAEAGSYEPEDRHVLAIEPAAAVRAHRMAHLLPALHGVAEELPLANQSVEASLAWVNFPPWPDLQTGLRGPCRGIRDRIIVPTFDGEVLVRANPPR